MVNVADFCPQSSPRLICVKHRYQPQVLSSQDIYLRPMIESITSLRYNLFGLSFVNKSFSHDIAVTLQQVTINTNNSKSNPIISLFSLVILYGVYI